MAKEKELSWFDAMMNVLVIIAAIALFTVFSAFLFLLGTATDE